MLCEGSRHKGRPDHRGGRETGWGHQKGSKKEMAVEKREGEEEREGGQLSLRPDLTHWLRAVFCPRHPPSIS